MRESKHVCSLHLPGFFFRFARPSKKPKQRFQALAKRSYKTLRRTSLARKRLKPSKTRTKSLEPPKKPTKTNQRFFTRTGETNAQSASKPTSATPTPRYSDGAYTMSQWSQSLEPGVDCPTTATFLSATNWMGALDNPTTDPRRGFSGGFSFLGGRFLRCKKEFCWGVWVV